MIINKIPQITVKFDMANWSLCCLLGSHVYHMNTTVISEIVISPIREGFIFTKLHICEAKIRENKTLTKIPQIIVKFNRIN